MAGYDNRQSGGNDLKARIFSIQKFCIHDGPGTRTTVFFAGCPLACKWCHNPEGKTGKLQILFNKYKCIGCGECLKTECGAQVFEPCRDINRNKCTGCGKCVPLCPANALEASYYEADTESIMASVRQDKAFYGRFGGMTLSGGEPLSQPEAALELLCAAKNEGITTAVETSGVFDKKYIPNLAETVDTFLWDYKDSNAARFFENTGGNLKIIEDNLMLADSLGAKIRLRCILIHGINTDKAHAEKIKSIAEKLRNIEGIDLIKYHPMAESKYEQLGIENTFNDKERIPSEEEFEMFRKILQKWVE